MQQSLKQVYLVGGAVRDKLLNIQSKDNDYVVIGETPETMEALSFYPLAAIFRFTYTQTLKKNMH